MTKIRILQLITDLNTGGAEMTLARLVTHLDPQQFETRVVSLIPLGPIGEALLAAGIQVETLGMPPGRATLVGFRQMLGILRRFRPHILQTWLYHADLLGLLAGKMTGIPAITWNIRNSTMDFSHYRRLSGLVLKACAALSGLPETLVVNSQVGRENHLAYGYHPRRWDYIPNGVETALFAPDAAAGSRVRAEWQVGAGEKLFGLVGRLDVQKDHPNFLRAAQLVAEKLPQARFVCVGAGPAAYLAELQELASSLGLAERVIWAGPRRDMPAVYNALDGLALASAYGEGFPNVVAEAMACGVPCVVSPSGDAPFLVGESGRVVPAKDPAALAEALLALPTGKSTAARERICQNFSLEMMVARYATLYEGLYAPLRGQNL